MRCSTLLQLTRYTIIHLASHSRWSCTAALLFVFRVCCDIQRAADDRFFSLLYIVYKVPLRTPG